MTSLNEIPVLILAFNRPELLSSLVDSLRPSRPKMVRVAIDGPRAGNNTDTKLVRQAHEIISQIDWTSDVKVLSRSTNLGLRRAVPDAVSWVLNENNAVIVVEDDVQVGPHFLRFACAMLDKYVNTPEIMHISGYNVVPKPFLEEPYRLARLSRIPESFAWATWSDRWSHYDDDLKWALQTSTKDLSIFLASAPAAKRWKRNFRLAEEDLISTWAYRWTATIWKHDAWCISPTENLVSYHGYSDGTHTVRKARWEELPIRPISIDEKSVDANFSYDLEADLYIQRKVFNSRRSFGFSNFLERKALQARKVIRERPFPARSDARKQSNGV